MDKSFHTFKMEFSQLFKPIEISVIINDICEKCDRKRRLSYYIVTKAYCSSSKCKKQYLGRVTYCEKCGDNWSFDIECEKCKKKFILEKPNESLYARLLPDFEEKKKQDGYDSFNKMNPSVGTTVTETVSECSIC